MSPPRRPVGGDQVSVVIATRDRPALLDEAIRSVRRQTRPAAEILVVDDGSAEPLSVTNGDGPPVRVLRNETSAGVGAARNAAWEVASGRFIAFLDDDDEWLAHKLERQLLALEHADPDTVAVVCGWELHDGGAVLRRRQPDPGRGLGYLAGPTAPPSVLLVRTDALGEVGGFDPELVFGEDWDLTVRLVEHGPVISLPEILVRRTAHPNRRFGRRLITDHRTMTRRLRPRVRALDRRDRVRIEAHHAGRLALYGTRVALEPLVVGRAPWRARTAWRRRRALR